MASPEQPAASAVQPSIFISTLRSACAAQGAFIQNSTAMALSFQAAVAGLGRLRATAADLGERALQQEIAAASQLARARGVQELYELQHQSAHNVLSLCETAFSESLSVLARTICDCTKPISDRVTHLLYPS